MADNNNQARADLFDIALSKLIGDAWGYAESDTQWYAIHRLLLEARPLVHAMKSTDTGESYDKIPRIESDKVPRWDKVPRISLKFGK